MQPIASRLPPDRTGPTYFSTGRAAFAFLIEDIVRPRRVYLPTFICWSLVSAMQRRFPDVELDFYTVNRRLECEYPDSLTDDDALVFVHYFGHRCVEPQRDNGGTLLEDLSHTLISKPATSGRYVFGSLRKMYRVADGGFVRGRFNPVYESSRRLDAWLRHNATDWRDMREAENMTDRSWSIQDIDSQSLAVVLSTDERQVQQRRQENDQFLTGNLTIGQPLIRYGASDCPLLHNRLLDTTEERDSLRSFLAQRGIFCSLHWPTHPELLARQDSVDISDALWLERHILSIPLAEHFPVSDMERICAACDEWQHAGG
jgi:hypothetical protein